METNTQNGEKKTDKLTYFKYKKISFPLHFDFINTPQKVHVCLTTRPPADGASAVHSARRSAGFTAGGAADGATTFDGSQAGQNLHVRCCVQVAWDGRRRVDSLKEKLTDRLSANVSAKKLKG